MTNRPNHQFALSWSVGADVRHAAKVRDDSTALSVSNSFGGRSIHQWSDLADIRQGPEKKHYLFSFKNGKKASISHSYAGLSELLETAQSKMEVRAGTARG